MSAVSELKTMVSIKDNVSAGLKSIQKEQLRIKKEIQETKEVLKDTFGKKWSIKLQSIELLRYLRDIGAEIRLLRKQLARMPKGSEGEISSPDMYFTENNITRVWSSEKQENSGTEEAPKFKWQPAATFPKMGEAGLSSKDEFAVSFVDKSITGVASIAFAELAKTASVALTGAAALSFAPLAPVVGLVASELTKGYLKHQDKLENLGSIMEQQGLHIENVFRGINPNMDPQAAKDKSVDYMKLIRDNSADTGFDQNDVLIAGTMAVELTDGNINGAMDYIRLAEDMKAVNHGSSVTETMQAIYEAKKGNMEALQRFLPGINLQNIKPEEFEGKVMKQLMEQYEGGTEEWLKTSAGLAARNEMTELKNMQDEAFKANENKKYQYENEYREMNMTPEERLDRLGGGFTGIGPIKQSMTQAQTQPIVLLKLQKEGPDRLDGGFTGIGPINQSIIKAQNQPITPFSPRDRDTGIRNNALSGNGMFKMPGAPSLSTLDQMHGTIVTLPKDNKSNDTTIQGPQLTFNFNGANLSAQEIISKVVPQLKLALQNMSPSPNSHARIGGALA